MDMNNGVVIPCRGGGAGWKGAKVENQDNCSSIINKIYFKNFKKEVTEL